MPAQAVQCPGCHATTASYPDPHGVRICNYCGTLFKLGSEGPQVLDAKAGVTAASSASRAWIWVASGFVILGGAVTAIVVNSGSNETVETTGPNIPAMPALDFSGVNGVRAGSPVPQQVESVAAPPPPKPPEGEFHFHHTRSSSGSTFYVLGEIENTGEVPLDHPKLIVVLKDEAGKEVASDFGFAARDTIYPGESSPISALVKDPPAYASMQYELVLREAKYFQDEAAGLKLVEPKVKRASYGKAMEAEGKVLNEGDSAAKFVKVEVQALDSEGKLLGLYSTYADGDELAAGGSARFRTPGMYFDTEPASYDFYVSGRPAK